MKPRSFFHVWVILCLFSGVLFWAQPVTWAGCCSCGGGSNCNCQNADCSTTNQDCNDPAFIASQSGCGCKKADPSIKAGQSPWKANQPLPQKPEALVATEKAQYQAYLDGVKKRPANVMSGTLTLWKSNVSKDLQRMAIMNSLGVTKDPQELDTLQFMLEALDSPSKQRKECLRLAKKGGKDQNLAAQRLSLLENNPNLQKRSN